jgi:hypothetical protein
MGKRKENLNASSSFAMTSGENRPLLSSINLNNTSATSTGIHDQARYQSICESELEQEYHEDSNNSHTYNIIHGKDTNGISLLRYHVLHRSFR